MTKILVIEENAELRRVLASHLEHMGYQVVQAVQGQAGIEVIEDIEPDLVVSGLKMERMEWPDFFQRLRQTNAGRNIPLLFVLPEGEKKVYSKLKEVAGIIKMPFTKEHFDKQVRELLRKDHFAATIGTQRVVLALEDERQGKVMADQLEKVGVTVFHAASGPEVITRVVQQEPDMIILDVLIEGMPSDELVGILRQMPQSEHKPILTFSFYRLEELGEESVRQKALKVDMMQSRCAEAGATDYFGRFNEFLFVDKVVGYLS